MASQTTRETGQDSAIHHAGFGRPQEYRVEHERRQEQGDLGEADADHR